MKLSDKRSSGAAACDQYDSFARDLGCTAWAGRYRSFMTGSCKNLIPTATVNSSQLACSYYVSKYLHVNNGRVDTEGRGQFLNASIVQIQGYFTSVHTPQKSTTVFHTLCVFSTYAAAYALVKKLGGNYTCDQLRWSTRKRKPIRVSTSRAGEGLPE